MVKVLWNEKAPLELLQSMPHVLDKKNLEEIQKVIDVDKFINSNILQCDLCGIYAPFCAECVRTLYCPCAQAYVRMKQKEGMQLEIAATEEPEDLPAEETAEEVAEAAVVEEAQPEEEPAPAEEKKYIRIAVARKKK